MQLAKTVDAKATFIVLYAFQTAFLTAGMFL